MNSENYGTHIKHIRQKMGLTQNQVAEALGVTPGYISNVENNRTAMSLRILTYYAKLCGCSLDSLVGTLDPEYSETALDRELYNAIMQLDVDTKEKLLKTIGTISDTFLILFLIVFRRNLIRSPLRKLKSSILTSIQYN